MKRRSSKADTRSSRSLLNVQQEGINFDREEVIWFNPPYNNRVSTNIGKAFFHLLRKHFPPSNRLHKICNKNVVKLSYSCTPNMANILSAQNKKLLKSHNGKSEFKPCNCRYKPSCPLNSNCRDKAIVYQATVQAKDKSKNYIGLYETEFKARFYNHKHSFNSDSKEMQQNFRNSFGPAKILV